MDKTEIIARLRARQDALQKAGVEHLAIFGSRARGDDRPGSDLDVLLDVAWERKFSLIDLVRGRTSHRRGDRRTRLCDHAPQR